MAVYPYCVTTKLNEIVRRNVRRIREEKHLTQDEVAQKAERHRNSIALFETKKSKTITLETVERLAEALGVSVADLVLEPPPTNEEAEVSLRIFLESPLGGDVTQDEIARLRKSMGWIGKPSPRSWGYMLDAIRSRKS